VSILTNTTFWKILEESGSTNETRGMRKIDFKTSGASLTTFSKTHSYGEYIFDWEWARAFEQNRLAYYPKLTSMVPFTPATAPHFHGNRSQWSDLLHQHDEHLKVHSSAHFLFTTPDEQIFLSENGYLLRDSFQYHFFNDGYHNFEDFLLCLKTKKAKNIRHERNHPSLKIERLTGGSIQEEHSREMYDFYLLTLEEKKAIPYLTQDFFRLLFQNLPNNILYVRASTDEKLVAGALFYYDEEKIYGRYWGARVFIPNLHFELCYYQGIEFCIEKQLKVFEAGAQGEHKIARGFRPILTSSAHKINHPEFSRAISNYIRDERVQVAQAMAELTKLLPFKS
jgi:predicted N-acyltransferase